MNKCLSKEELLASQLAMLKEIHNCCVEHNLTYYLAYGTLIGAVRHQGFIPWDDDLDIMMPVDDYDKLRSIYKSDRYFITDCFHDKRHQLCFPRMYDGRTCLIEDNSALGVFVDIYLIHGGPTNEYQRVKHALSILNLNKKKNSLSKWINRIKRHFLPSVWNQRESKIITSICKSTYNRLHRYDYKEGIIAYAYGGGGITDMFWKSYFDDKVLLPFNGEEFYAPKKYREVLATTYGDYMKLPPEEDRHPYHGSDCFCWKESL